MNKKITEQEKARLELVLSDLYELVKEQRDSLLEAEGKSPTPLPYPFCADAEEVTVASIRSFVEQNGCKLYIGIQLLDGTTINIPL